jgi:cupin fold WbuC family metalloprotein
MLIKIYSKINPSKLLHLVDKRQQFEGRVDIAPEDQFLQMAKIKMSKGKVFRPHQHIWKDSPTEKVIAQESWVVLKGSVKIFFYDTDGTLICSEIITPGDISMTFEGGHKYEIIEDDTVVYEFKTGPYTGVENDKTFISE